MAYVYGVGLYGAGIYSGIANLPEDRHLAYRSFVRAYENPYLVWLSEQGQRVCTSSPDVSVTTDTVVESITIEQDNSGVYRRGS